MSSSTASRAASPSAQHDTAYTDGACEPRNPGGTGGWGYVLLDADGATLAEGYGVLPARPTMTSNVAEYGAACQAVLAYRDLGRPGPLLVRTDSQLVVHQMRGEWRVRGGHYVPVHARLQQFLLGCECRVAWEWIPRDENERADVLSKRGLEEAGIGGAERGRGTR